eukprot:XP_011670393.1 PREDICTED: sushi domain-containing protein 2-like [Strongylocentrotus purpuratus]
MSSLMQTIWTCQLIIWVHSLIAHGCNVGDQPSPVHLSDWTSEPGTNLAVTWDPAGLHGNDMVEIIVYEFTVDINGRYRWEPVHIVPYGIVNEGGRFEFVINRERSVDDISPRVGAIGVFTLNEANSLLERRAIWSEIHPLNWLYPINMTSWCNSWITRELTELNQWLPQRPVCPCTERQARRDIGSFTVSLETDRPGVTLCVNSNIPSPSGAGQECCYSSDGHLIEVDAIGAGFSHRQHERVTSPNLSSGLGPVPVLSHYLADTMPYLQCCVADQSENGQFCYLYRTVRPPKNCYGYRPPQPVDYDRRC